MIIKNRSCPLAKLVGRRKCLELNFFYYDYLRKGCNDDGSPKIKPSISFQVETLRSAIEYIRALQDLVTEKRSGKRSVSDSKISRTEVEDAELLLEDDAEDEIADSVAAADL